MAEHISLSLVNKKLLTDQIVLTVGYDIDNLKDSRIRNVYKGEITEDRYGRRVPKHAHGTINLEFKTSSTKIIVEKTMELFERIINKNLLCRRVHIFANKLVSEEEYNESNNEKKEFEQLDLFSTVEEKEKQKEETKKKLESEKNIQDAILNIKNKFGKNAILKGMNFEEGGTMIDRNSQNGGHAE